MESTYKKDDVIEVVDGETSKGTGTEMKTYYEFGRVDFTMPSTVVNYGNDVRNEMEALAKSISKMSGEDVQEDPKVTICMARIAKFGQILNKTEEDKTKAIEKEKTKLDRIEKVRIPFFRTLLIKLVEKAPGMSVEQVETYADQFDTFSDDIDVVAKSVAAEQQNTLKQIGMNEAFIKKMEPLIEKLSQLIKAGYEDKDKYSKEVIEPLEAKVAVSQDPELQRELRGKKQILDIFESKLVELGKDLILYKTIIDQTKAELEGNYKLVFILDSYLKSSVPALRVQGAAMIGVKRQNEVATTHAARVELTNQIMVSNAEMLTGTLGKITTMEAEGNISIATLEQLRANIEKSTEILEQGAAIKKECREKAREVIFTITESLRKYDERLSDVLTDGSIDASILDGKNPTVRRLR